MKKFILIAVALAFGKNVFAKDIEQWDYCDGKLDKVFEIHSTSNDVEILRMYRDGTFEHLNYELKHKGKEEVSRTLGKYAINRSKITFTVSTKKSFTGKFKYGSYVYNGKFYANLFDMTFRKKKELFKSTRDRKFFKPFFICLNKDVVVNNTEASKQLDLKRVLDYILAGKEKEEDKVMAIMKLIIESIEYDYDGYYKGVYANKQNDAVSILMGNKRVAVCAGYSYTMKTLCDLAGIQAETISGNTKQGFADLMRLGGYHAWNIISVHGKKRLYDVTWADNGTTLDMRWIDVDPRVMIGTHFPDKSSDQLVDAPITQEQFLNAPVFKPLTSRAKPVEHRLKAKQFVGNTFKFALPGNHDIEGTMAPASLVETVYSSEGNTSTLSYSPKEIGSSYSDNDSTYFVVTLTDLINPIELEIDGNLELRMVVYKGSQSDLLRYYISKANTTQSDNYVKAVISAIKLDNVMALKNLVGSSNPVFFDKKGKLKLEKKAISACLNWSGDLTSLTRMVPHTIKSDGNIVQSGKEELRIEIPHKLKFMLEFDGKNYSIIGVEVI
jgi:hypothetical protein